jgi:serine/threonine protein kinase
MEFAGFDIVEEILRNDRFVVYRGRRRRNRQPVLLKAFSGVAGRADHERLEREFDLRRGLSIGLPRAYELVRGPEGPCLVMEDRGFVPLSRILSGGRLDLDAFFRIAVALCGVLGELHRRDLIHGTVNPACILVDSTSHEVQLLSVAISAATSVDAQAPLPPGSAAYMSPEQTGRINRTVDHRTDFYSLGAVFYEALSGAPPFRTSDSLELIHAHIAKAPAALTALDVDIPEPLSHLVLKLLAKAPEDRYATALGIKHDLEQCERQWSTRRAIAPFQLARWDVSDRFVIPQRLYGREGEAARLLEAFDEVCNGASALMLVSGYSGSGKTSLIHEWHRPIVRRRGYFIEGKFDQVVRNIPFGAPIQALRSLVRQLLTASEDQLVRWREDLSTALGVNGGVLAEVIPEIELVMGDQPPPAPLGPAEAQNRFRYVFQSFIATLARAEHPLVIFLDDVQWTDTATLDLLQALLTSPNIRHLLFVCAYRDNEIDAQHVLTAAASRLESAHARVHRLALAALICPIWSIFSATLCTASRQTLNRSPV